jgi:hypothetical protein
MGSVDIATCIPNFGIGLRQLISFQVSAHLGHRRQRGKSATDFATYYGEEINSQCSIESSALWSGNSLRFSGYF